MLGKTEMCTLLSVHIKILKTVEKLAYVETCYDANSIL